MERDLEQRIRERAYEIWQEEGRPEGREEEHWQKAASEFGEARETPSKPSAKAAGSAKRTTTKKPVASKAKATPAEEPKAKPAARSPRGATSGKGKGKTKTD
ncbi:DUF2934 domain-containing protein [Sphingosinithalassobacter sp. LHW66-3]|uniref:DUF2934 domain-containing protein n=1 Tax=Sphingosinithalassobacter sp. LHW66-3 TaxID=3424718 RepID=UPI003D6B60C4